MHSHHGPRPALAVLYQHAIYLQRKGAGQDGQKPQAYSADRDEVVLKNEVVGWTKDRHHFRLIISPENAADLVDLKAYTRELMAQVERDLGTRLQWYGVNHFNTDNPHAHVLIRGVDENGKDLVINRDYISYGIRDRASKLATEKLGERSREEMHQVRQKETQASRLTYFDRVIDRNTNDKGVLDAAKFARQKVAGFDKKLILKRLGHLESLGLAQRLWGSRWRLSPHLVPRLRELGQRGDVIKNLHRRKGLSTNNMRVYRPGDEITQPVLGRVVQRGVHDELRDIYYVLVRDLGGRHHYVQTRFVSYVSRLKRGSVVSLKPSSLGYTRIVPHRGVSKQGHARAPERERGD